MTNTPEAGQQRATLWQSISGAPSGSQWYLTVRFDGSGYEGNGCHIDFGTDFEALTSRNYYYNDPMPTTGYVYASGTFSGSANWFYMSFVCDSGGSAPIERRQAAEIRASFDDISLAYALPVPEQLLVNNDFSSGTVDPWITASWDGQSTFGVVDGRLVTTFNGDLGAYVYQYLSKNANSGQSIRLQADIYLTISDQSGSCYIEVTAGWPPLFEASNVDHSEHFVIDKLAILDGGAGYLMIQMTCTGTGQGTIALDNVYFTINPSDTPEESPGLPSSTSTTSETSSSTPTPSSSPRQVIVNNDFESGSLDPWYTQSFNGGSEPSIVEDGRAIIKYTTLTTQTWHQASFEQYLSGITREDQGKSARVQADIYVNLGEPGTSCYLLVMSGDDLFWKRDAVTTSQMYHIDEQIALQYASPMVTIFFSCNGLGSSTYIAIDNVYYYVDVPATVSTSATTETTTPTPTSIPRRQLIVNNDFASETLNPWTTLKYDDYSDPGVVEDGRAIVRIPRIVSTNWAQGSFDQQLRTLSQDDIGKLATVKADVEVNIGDAGNKCFVQIYSVDDNFWRSGDIISSQTFHIDNQLTLQYASAAISVYWGCYGTGTTTSVAIDNLYYYVDEPGTTASSTSAASKSSTSTATSTSTSSSPSPSVRATVSCPVNDAQTYTNDDGSQYMIVCGQDYDGSNIVGINPVSAANFTACVDLCMYQGTQCAGVSWFEAQANCFLKTKMSPSVNQGVVVYSAIRVTGPASGPVASRVIANGDFVTDLSSWTTSQQNSQGASFVRDNGRA